MRRVAVGEAHTVGGQAVDVRRGNVCAAIDADQGKGKLVFGAVALAHHLLHPQDEPVGVPELCPTVAASS